MIYIYNLKIILCALGRAYLIPEGLIYGDKNCPETKLMCMSTLVRFVEACNGKRL